MDLQQVMAGFIFAPSMCLEPERVALREIEAERFSEQRTRAAPNRFQYITRASACQRSKLQQIELGVFQLSG